MKRLAFATTLLLCFWAVSTAQAETARQIAQRVFPAVVMLILEDANGLVLSQGSGFFVAPGVVATNLHVVEGAVSGVAKLVGDQSLYEVDGVVGLDERRDLVILAVSRAAARFLTLGNAGQVAVGDRIYAVGNPLGLEGTFSEGIVSGLRHVRGDTLFQITAPISPGSSGGPILDARGRVIGVAVATFEGGQNLNFAIPSSYLASLLVKPQSLRPLSIVGRSKAALSAVEELGQKNLAGVTVTNFHWETRWQGGASDYSVSIRNLLRQPIKDVSVIAIFYDKNDDPIDVHSIGYSGAIPGRLAKRVVGRAPPGVRSITESSPGGPRVEFRVLDFAIGD